MYVNKMVFIERDNFDREEFDMLEDKNVICDTDYGTTEIMSSTIQGLVEDNDAEVIEILKERLGSDVFEGLAKEELDFALIVY